MRVEALLAVQNPALRPRSPPKSARRDSACRPSVVPFSFFLAVSLLHLSSFAAHV